MAFVGAQLGMKRRVRKWVMGRIDNGPWWLGCQITEVLTQESKGLIKGDRECVAPLYKFVLMKVIAGGSKKSPKQIEA